MKLTRDENRDLAALMLQETWSETQAREAAHRAMAPGDQPYMVVCFGMLSYRVLRICKFKDEAEGSLIFWHGQAERGGFEVRPLSRDVLPQDLQVRQQWDLDELVAAIRSAP